MELSCRKEATWGAVSFRTVLVFSCCYDKIPGQKTTWQREGLPWLRVPEKTQSIMVGRHNDKAKSARQPGSRVKIGNEPGCEPPKLTGNVLPPTRLSLVKVP